MIGRNLCWTIDLADACEAGAACLSHDCSGVGAASLRLARSIAAKRLKGNLKGELVTLQGDLYGAILVPSLPSSL
jgi:hypothetical protein